MEFEFDSRKSSSNRQKHGIDFAKAQALWDDPDLIEIPARTTDESRSVVIGRIGNRHWSAIITHRDVTRRRAARPFTPRIARVVTHSGMWHRYVSDMSN